MTKTNPGYKMFIGLLKEDQYTQLKKLAAIRNISLAKTVRQIIDDYLAGSKLE